MPSTPTPMFMILNDPVPSLGGNNLAIDMGVQDQRPVEERKDVLVYTSDPLEQPLEVTGPVTVALWASSSAVDTDFTAKLVDVHPERLCAESCRRHHSRALSRVRERAKADGGRQAVSVHDRFVGDQQCLPARVIASGSKSARATSRASIATSIPARRSAKEPRESLRGRRYFIKAIWRPTCRSR